MEEKVNLKEIINNRISKLNEIKGNGIDPFPHNYSVTHTIHQILENEEKLKDQNLSIVGRIISLRKMGKACFMNIINEHSKIQLYIKNINLPENIYDIIIRKLDIGDILGAEGVLFYTKTNELSIKCTNASILSKSIRPLPNLKEKEGKSFFAFEDKELRYRNRHLDLIANKDVVSVFVKRSKIISKLRDYLDNLGYLEVETPILQPIYGGANAKPFKTYHNTLDQNLYLRIADELYLKRLIIGGINKVYEISKNFRNEGMDKNHNPEFTMLEFYSAYSDVYDMMDLTESMIRDMSKYLKNRFTDLSLNINFENKFDRFSFYDKLFVESKIKFDDISTKDLYALMIKNKVSVDKKMSHGKLLDKAFSFYVEPKLVNPTFILDYPLELSPLAKRKRDESEGLVERFELFVSGMEIANSFTELNDPIDQSERLEKQSNLRELGDEEAQVVDQNFIEAMECGMPPCGGVGIGIDRLVMLLTKQSSIKDVILFPAMRNKEV